MHGCKMTYIAFCQEDTAQSQISLVFEFNRLICKFDIESYLLVIILMSYLSTQKDRKKELAHLEPLLYKHMQ